MALLTVTALLMARSRLESLLYCSTKLMNDYKAMQRRDPTVADYSTAKPQLTLCTCEILPSNSHAHLHFNDAGGY